MQGGYFGGTSTALNNLMHLPDVARNLEILDIRNQVTDDTVDEIKLDITYASAPGVQDGTIKVINLSNGNTWG